MKTPIQVRPTIYTTILALFCAATTARAGLMDPGFENNPLTTDAAVLGDFAGQAGNWGTEGGTITAATFGLTPPEGTQMLSMTGSGGTYQTMQVIDVSSDAALISAGGAIVNFNALFNTSDLVSSAVAGVSISFYSAANTSSGIGTLFGSLTLDGDDSTWQQITATGAIPVNTSWMLSQVTYNAAPLGENPGFVDAASLTIDAVPEPGTALFGMACVGVAALRRRRRA